MRRAILLGAALLALLAGAQAAFAQGFLISSDAEGEFRLPRPVIIIPPPHPIPRPRPEPASYKIKELGVDVSLQDQVAQVQVTQSFVNTGSRQMEVCFVFPLPYDGAVDRLTFMVDGKEYEAKLLKADEARRIYESYMRRQQDPALVEWMGTGLFKTSVFPVPAGAERTVSLRYSQLCRTYSGLTDFLFPLSTAKFTSHPVEKVRFDLTVNSQVKIKNVYSPSHSVEIKRPSEKVAKVSFESKNEVPTSDFRLMYDVGDQEVKAQVLSYRPDDDEDGFFLMLVSPDIKKESDETPKKAVVLVLDRSGSMSGKKIEQAKEALKFVLNNLREGDVFNLVAYDSTVESFKPELQRYNDKTRAEALGFVEGIYAGGSTNISGALESALSQLPDDSSRPSYVIFLTDGLPTTGETNEAKIAQAARSNNKAKARLFTFGVGYDVNSRLLDKLAREGRGQSEFVRPNEDIEEHVSRLYNRIGAPVMTDVELAIDQEGHKPEKGPVANRLYPKEVHDLFAGEQLVIVGRYKTPGDAKVTVTGKVDDKKQKFDFPAKLVKESKDESFAFIEKLWAIRRVGEIIDEIDLKGKNQELVDEMVKLSTKHGIITPYTSFLADDQGSFRELARNRQRASDALEALSEAEGRFGFAQRAAKGALQRSYNVAPGAGAVPLAEADAAAAPAASGYGGAFGGARRAGAPTTAPQLARPADRDEAARPAVQNVAQVGKKTFYRRGDRWVDSAATEEQEKSAQKLERYTKEWFDLVARHGKDAAKYLAIEGDVTVVLDGQAYRF